MLKSSLAALSRVRPVTLSLCLLFLATAAIADVGTDTAEAADPTAAVAALAADEATATAEDAPETPAADGGSCSSPALDAITYAGFFGPHCSYPSFKCNVVEPGIGFGCECTYRCDCAYCTPHGLTEINCVLIDDGGCLACPDYD